MTRHRNPRQPRRCPANAIRRSAKERRDIAGLIVTRMLVLAETLAGDSDPALWEEFVALGYQLRLNVPAPDAEVQAALDVRGLLLRRFEDPELDPSDDEIDGLVRRD